MALLQNIWNDLKRGENIDVYVTVVAAVGLAILNIFGLATDTLVTSLTLAVLALITFSLLGNRYRLEGIAEEISSTEGNTILEDFPEEFISELERAQEVLLTGVHQRATLNRYYLVFEQNLKRGGSMRVLVVDPDGSALKMSAMRYTGRVNAEHERVRIQATLDSLCELKKVAPGKLEIRTIDYLLEYGACLLNPTGKVYIERYTFKSVGGSRKPKVVYTRRDEHWYNLVNSELEALWESSVPWVCEETAE